jgi:2-polyprenyl-6-methoxyphenol hydroxylase-like FAD-dependent oxidoreductase
VADVIAATDESAILRNDIYDRPPLKQWSSARVTLLGDAAHPTTPNLGQGACQAIEDAVVLAQCLAGEPEVGAALRRYESARIPRTTRIVLLSRRFGQIGQLQSPLLCRLRDAVVRMTPASQAQKQIAWVTHFPES